MTQVINDVAKPLGIAVHNDFIVGKKGNAGSRVSVDLRLLRRRA